MKFVLVSLTVGSLVVGGVLLARNLAPPGPHFRREMAKDSANPAARREAEVALRVQLAVLARAESAYVADSGRPTRQLPPRYGYTKRRGDIAYVRVEQESWGATLTHARTGTTCTMFAGLNRATGRYLPGQPNCYSELGYDTVHLAAAPAVPTPFPAPTSTPDVTSPEYEGRPHRDWGPVNNTPPRMPWIVKDECPGEYCAFGRWAACSTVVARRDKRSQAQPAFTIQPGEEFTALTGDVHVDVPGMVVFRRAYSNPANPEGEPVESILFTPADTLYVLHAISEGFLMWYYRGRAAMGYQFWIGDPFHPGDAEPGDAAVMIRSPQVNWWVRVRNRAGQEGWIVYDYRRMAQDNRMDELSRCLRTARE